MLARILAAILLGLLVGSASAQTPRRVRFAYELLDGNETCPDEAKLRAGVSARLGYDAFDVSADETLRVRLQRTGREREALITITDGQGQLRAERRLVSRQGDCVELASSVELAVSIAIDPFRVTTQPPPVATPAPPAPVPAPPAPVVPSVPAPTPLAVQIKAGAVVGQGSAPTRTLGFVLGGGARRGRWSLGLEARFDVPRSRDLPVGEIRSYALMGTLAPCVHLHGLAACALCTAGGLHAQGRGLASPQQVTRSYLAAGTRLGYALSLSRRFSLLFHGDATTPLHIAELQVDHVAVWTTPRLALALGIDLGLDFP